MCVTRVLSQTLSALVKPIFIDDIIKTRGAAELMYNQISIRQRENRSTKTKKKKNIYICRLYGTFDEIIRNMYEVRQ